MIDFTSFYGWVIATGLIFLILVFRYFFFGIIIYWFFYIRNPQKWNGKKIFTKTYSKVQFRNEVKWSMISSLIFAIAGSIFGCLWQSGYTKIYTSLNTFGWWYLPVSMIALMFLQETYYYWLHRWMHLPGVFRYVHKVHHDSHITSPWTAFSFHPLEAILQAIFLPIILLIIPAHPVVLITMLMLMTISGFINHLGYEIYPDSFKKHFLGKSLIGATHHARHHKQYKFNFGLYFTYWDKWLRTESPGKLRVVRKKQASIPLRDNRARLYIVKPRERK